MINTLRLIITKAKNPRVGLIGALASTVLISACGGDSGSSTGVADPSSSTGVVSPASSSGSGTGGVTQPASTYKLSGTIRGLGASGLSLQEGSSVIEIPASGVSFSFPTSFAEGAQYSVTIKSQPTGMTCGVTNGNGKFTHANVTNVVIACSNLTYSVGGTVSGYVSGNLILRDSTYPLGPDVSVVPNASTGTTSFQMTHRSAYGASYSIFVAVQPSSQYTCSVSNGIGTIAGDVTDIQVVCSVNAYPMMASIHGLLETGLVISNASDDVPVALGVQRITFPTAVAFGSSYSVHISHQPNYQQCSVSPSGTGVMKAHGNIDEIDISCGQESTVSTLVKGVYRKLAFDANGNAYASYQNSIAKITPDGVVSTFAGTPEQYGYQDGPAATASFFSPESVAFDRDGNLYVADLGNNRIRKISPAGFVTTFAGNGATGDVDGEATVARITLPYTIAIDSVGNVYVTESGNNAIRKVSPTGIVSTFAGAKSTGFVDGVGTEARFNQPLGMAIDSQDNVFVADSNNEVIRKISPLGLVTTVAGTGGQGQQDGPGTAATFRGPTDIAIDSKGYAYVTDYYSNVIREIFPDNVVSTLAGTGASGGRDGAGSVATFYGPRFISLDPAGNIFVTMSYNSPTDSVRKIVLSPPP